MLIKKFLKIPVIARQKRLFYLTWSGLLPSNVAYHHIDFTWPVPCSLKCYVPFKWSWKYGNKELQAHEGPSKVAFTSGETLNFRWYTSCNNLKGVFETWKHWTIIYRYNLSTFNVKACAAICNLNVVRGLRCNPLPLFLGVKKKKKTVRCAAWYCKLVGYLSSYYFNSLSS